MKRTVQKNERNYFGGLNDKGFNASKQKTVTSQAQRPAIGVMFVPFTWGLELTKDVREVERRMKEISG